MQTDFAYEFGRSSGALFFTVLVLIGALRLCKKRSAPDVNLKCLWSLIITFFAFAAVRPLSLLFSDNRIGLMVSGGVLAAFLLVALFLAIRGLIELQRDTDRNRGGKYALWTLGLVAVLFVLPAIGGFTKGRTKAKSLPLADGHPPGHELAFTNLNFRFTVPEHPWVQVDAKKINPDATVVFMRGNPQLFCIIIAEQMDSYEMDTDGLVEIAQGQIRSALRDGYTSRPQPHTINGVSGSIFDESGLINGRNLFGLHWCAVTNGYVYQILVRGFHPDTEKIRNAAIPLFAGFNLIDAERESDDSSPPASGYHSLAFRQ